MTPGKPYITALHLYLLICCVALLSCATAPPAEASKTAPARADESEAELPPTPPTTPIAPEPAMEPVALNQVEATVRGCLANTNLGKDPEQRLPPKRGADEPLPELLAEAYDWGLVVKHDLRHPCCLKGAVDAEIEGNLVVVTERFSGTPCNSHCWSTVVTRVGLPKGSYDLLVEQVGSVAEKTLLFTTLEVGDQGE